MNLKRKPHVRGDEPLYHTTLCNHLRKPHVRGDEPLAGLHTNGDVE